MFTGRTWSLDVRSVDSQVWNTLVAWMLCCVVLRFRRLWLAIQGVLLLVWLESRTAFPEPEARALQSGAENVDNDLVQGHIQHEGAGEAYALHRELRIISNYIFKLLNHILNIFFFFFFFYKLGCTESFYIHQLTQWKFGNNWSASPLQCPVGIGDEPNFHNENGTLLDCLYYKITWPNIITIRWKGTHARDENQPW
jgi:hypothetical protein